MTDALQLFLSHVHMLDTCEVLQRTQQEKLLLLAERVEEYNNDNTAVLVTLIFMFRIINFHFSKFIFAMALGVILYHENFQ